MLNSLVGEHMEGQDLHAHSNKSRTEPLFLLVLLSCSLYNTLMTAGELFSLGFISQSGRLSGFRAVSQKPGTNLGCAGGICSGGGLAGQSP